MSVTPSVTTRFYAYANSMARDPVELPGHGIMALVATRVGHPHLVLLVDLQENNQGASLTNVIERVVARVTRDLLAPAGISPREVVWIESDSEGGFDRAVLDFEDNDSPIYGSVGWKPLGARTIESFLQAFPDVGQVVWSEAERFIIKRK